jgi:tetratricopeptide (TPR) repeat protein
VIVRLCIGVLAGLWLGNAALADAESRRLIQEGVRAFESGDLGTALERFRAARNRDPRDGDAVFYLGAVANRQGRFDAALGALTQARGFTDKHPELDFETGWALHGLGKHREAIRALESYEQARPGRGKTSEFRGRAHAALGEFDQAERLLDEALRRDPSLAATVRLQRAAIASARQQPKLAADELDLLLKEAPNSPVAEAVRRRIAAVLPETDKRWRVAASFGVGYNDNVIALGDNQPLPGSITSKSSPFLRATVEGEFDVSRGQTHRVTLGYGAVADHFFDVGSQSAQDHQLSADWRVSLLPGLSAALRGFGGLTMIDGAELRRYAGVRAALGWQPIEALVIEPSAQLVFSDFNRQGITADSDDRTGRTATYSVVGYYKLPWFEAVARGGAFYIDGATSGDNFDFHAPGLTAGLQAQLPWRVLGALDYTYGRSIYSNPDPRAVPAFVTNRRDTTHSVALQVSRPVLYENVAVYLRLSHTDNASNIAVFDYDQTVVVGGVVVRF